MNEEQVTRLLQDLVCIPSVNPSGDPGTSVNNTGESRMVAYLAEFFRKLALDVEINDVEPDRANIVSKFASRGAKTTIALAPHTDTVSVAGMTINPFGGEVRDGRLYGRGATDTKGSMAAMLAALANVVRKKEFREGDVDVVFCGLMGEESGNDGARALVQDGFKADFAIAGEPTDCRIVHTHKGSVWFKIITRGKSVHGSMPEKGESAIGKMAEVVQFMLGDYTKSLRTMNDPVLGSPTVNVGVIRGGAQTNIVPDYCEIEIDRRTIPGETDEVIMSGLCEKLKHLRIEIQTARECRPLYTDPQSPFVQKLAAATEAGRDALIGAPWFCDAALFAEKGTPAVAFGPGSVTQAHTADEFIELKEVFRAAQILERFLLSSAG